MCAEPVETGSDYIHVVNFLLAMYFINKLHWYNTQTKKEKIEVTLQEFT